MRRSLRCLLPSLLVLAACPASPNGGSNVGKPVQPPTTPKQTDPPPPVQPNVAKPDAPEPDAPEPATTEVVAEVAAGFNAFGIELYRKLATAPGDQVISPASVAVALAMTHAGARGDTAKEMEVALHYSRPAAEVQAAVGTMLTGWNAPHEGLELAVANRLFGETSVAFERPFLDLTRTVFAAPLEPVGFKTDPAAARVHINDWVEAQTHDRIQELLPPSAVNAATRLVLVNAIYFKAPWLHPFPEHRTKRAPFFATGGKRDVPTMGVTEQFAFTERTADGVQVIELPYGGPGFAMTLVVPLAKDGLPAVEASLTAERLAGWVGALASERIDLSLPKFRIAPSESLQLATLLGELGIRKAFTMQADLTGIAPASEMLVLAEVYHKGFIAVDEKGTEAAAATAVAARAGGMPSEPRTVKVDRPFLYVIRDTRSGLVMFIGRVVSPTADG
jgi:serpin B